MLLKFHFLFRLKHNDENNTKHVNKIDLIGKYEKSTNNCEKKRPLYKRLIICEEEYKKSGIQSIE